MVEREERVRNAQVQYEANQREIARLQGFVDRFGAKTMGASMAQSRLKTIEKLEATGPEAPQVGESVSGYVLYVGGWVGGCVLYVCRWVAVGVGEYVLYVCM